MNLPNYPYPPQEVYQWANGDRDEPRRSTEDGLLGSNMTTTGPRSYTRAPSSRFNEHTVLTSGPFPGAAICPTPDDLAQPPDRHNFTTNANMNSYHEYAYQPFDSPSLSLVIPPSNHAEVCEQFVSQPQTPSSAGEYEGPGVHPPGEHTQHRGYLASSRSTVQQHPARPPITGTIGPTRNDVWRVKSRPYQHNLPAAQLTLLHSPRGTAEERRRALKLQFQAQYKAASPITPDSSSPSVLLTSGTIPYRTDSRQPLPNQQVRTSRVSPNTTDPDGYHQVITPSQSHFDKRAYPQNFPGGWSDPNAQHASISNSGSGASPEPRSLSQINAGTHVPTASSAPTTSSAAGTVFIHSNLTQPSRSTTNDARDYPDYQYFFPLQTEDHRQLRVAMHHILNSEWKLRNELEPTSQDILQFSTKVNDGAADGEDSGAFRYRCLLYHKGQSCNKSWARAERMLAHLRGAIDLRPFACEGAGDGCDCGMRFFAEDTLQQHRKNIKAVGCPYCGAGVTPRNIKRHFRNNCPKSPQRSGNRDATA